MPPVVVVPATMNLPASIFAVVTMMSAARADASAKSNVHKAKEMVASPCFAMTGKTLRTPPTCRNVECNHKSDEIKRNISEPAMKLLALIIVRPRVDLGLDLSSTKMYFVIYCSN